jgi:dihydropyrimidinase
MLDLVIRGGMAVTAASSFAADIGVRDGKVAQIGGEMSAGREIDATGKMVVPGGVDVHVHLQSRRPRPPGFPQPELRENFYSGTLGAAAGGITTVGEMVFHRGDDGAGLLATLERATVDAEADSIIDFVLHPVIGDPSPAVIAEIGELAAAGYASIKIFMMERAFDERQPDYVRAIAAAGRDRLVSMIHCEDASVIDYCQQRLLAEGKSDIRYFPESRPSYGEAMATARAIALGRATEAPIYIVHLGSAWALAEARRARAAGQAVCVETRPLYLHLTRERYERPDGAKYVGFPPLGEQADVDAIWDGLRAGDVDTVCSDHAPWTLAQKLDPTLRIGSFRAGVANLETLRPLLYSEGVRTGRLSLSRWVDLTATNAAKLFGIYPQKGTIGVGADADLVVWDPEKVRTIRDEETRSVADYDVFAGFEVQGWPAYTLARGEIIFADGEVTGARGRGRRVRQGPHESL